MLFWKMIKLEKAIPSLHKCKKTSDVNKSHIKNTYTPLKSEKAFCRHSLYGSMTVEASLVLPLVFFVWMACVAWTSIVNVHASIQNTLGQSVMEMSIASGSDETLVKNTGVLAAWAQSMNLDDLEKGGIEKVYGFDFSESRILENDAGILLKVYYRIKVLEGIIPIPAITLSNQVYTRAWIGGDSIIEGQHLTSERNESVYVSEYGHVYHTDRLCSHIHLTIHMVDESQTKGYMPCDKCMDGRRYQGQTYYVTEYGEHYHSRLGCSGLKRQIDCMPMTEVATMGYRPCSRCSGGE